MSLNAKAPQLDGCVIPGEDFELYLEFFGADAPPDNNLVVTIHQKGMAGHTLYDAASTPPLTVADINDPELLAGKSVQLWLDTDSWPLGDRTSYVVWWKDTANNDRLIPIARGILEGYWPGHA